jgi:hypothetical protein
MMERIARELEEDNDVAERRKPRRRARPPVVR